MKTIVAFKIEDSDRDLLEYVADIRGETKSIFIRRALKRELVRLGFGSDEEAQALEVTEREPTPQ